MVQDYHDKPSFTPKGTSFFGLYFGVELEVEVKDSLDRHQKADSTANLFKNHFVICKHDSSIGYGFEVCSSPASINYHRTAWDKFFEKGLDGLKGYNSDNCGMHVHISRAPLTNLQIGKMLVFIHNPDNHKFIERVAQRGSNKYCKFDDKRIVTDARPEKCIRFDRHTAVNLKNPATVEFRIFKANLKREMFLKNIEFCHALAKFTWPGTVSIPQSRSWKNFVIFIDLNKDTYPNLYNYLDEFGWISKRIRVLNKKPKYINIEPLIKPFAEILREKSERSFQEENIRTGLTAF